MTIDKNPMPEVAWLEDEFGDDHEDQGQYGSWDVQNIMGYTHKYIRADVVDNIRAELAEAQNRAEAENERLRKTLEPFSAYAGFIFAMNFNAPDVIHTIEGNGVTVDLLAESFFDARKALSEGNR